MKAGEKAAGTTTAIGSATAASGGGKQQKLKKGPWTAAEDAILKEYVKTHGEGNWNSVQKNSSLQRSGKSCRRRWTYHLRPNLKKGSFSPQEEKLIFQLHAQYGNQWARLATHLPGRTDNGIKNFWNTWVKRQQRARVLIYPPEIQPPTSCYSQCSSAPRIVTSQPETTALMERKHPHLSLFNSASFSPVAASLSVPYQNPLGSPLHETTREKNLSSVPIAAASLYTDSPSSSSAASSLQYYLGNFELSSQPPPLQCPPPYSLDMELPSNQLFSDSGGEQMACPTHCNSGLLDALLQDSRGVGKPFMYNNSSDYDCSVGERYQSRFSSYSCSPFFPYTSSPSILRQLFSSAVGLPCSPGIQAQDEMATETTLADTMTANNNNGSEFSNGLQACEFTNDDIGVEMQQLSSTPLMAPAEHDPVLGSCSWGYLPNIATAGVFLHSAFY